MLRSLTTTALLALLALTPLAAAGTLHVDATLASGANDGSSWADAFQGSNGLQVALTTAVSGDDIYVADGTYFPSATGARNAAFNLKNGVAIYGSFLGGEASPDERPPFGTADSILSGDLNGDDGSSLFGDNSFHLIKTAGTNATAVIDGFVVSSGNANNGSNNKDRGAGILCVGNVSPTVNNCRFIANRCTFGGAAGYINNGAAPVFSNCTFEDGDGGAFGGAFDIAGGGLVRFHHCLFRGNTAARAGALEIFSSNGVVVNNSVFVDNTATGGSGGGAVWLGSGGSARLRSCTIVNNTATNHSVGGVQNSVGNFQILNSIVYGNTGSGGGMASNNQITAGTLVFNSLVQGGFPGAGNVSGDPLFVDAPGHDFALTAASPAIDAGDNAQLFAGTDVDFAGLPRLADSLTVTDTGAGTAPIIDMGAHEFPSAWLELGNALAGSTGAPKLLMTGDLSPLSLTTAALSNALPSSPVFILAGFTAINAPAKGGVVVPALDVLRFAMSSGSGTLNLPFSWPAGLPAGFETYYQLWVQDAGGPVGFAASNGVRGVTP